MTGREFSRGFGGKSPVEQIVALLKVLKPFILHELTFTVCTVYEIMNQVKFNLVLPATENSLHRRVLSIAVANISADYVSPGGRERFSPDTMTGSIS